MPSAKGVGQTQVSPRTNPCTSASWRWPPNTHSAALIAARAAGVSPCSPSAPIPTIASQAEVLACGSVADMALKVLILGGTSEGRVLAEQLAADARVDALLSFAGRTASLQAPALPHRIGGFGGVAGLIDFLRAGGFHALIDATHPFAARMSANAVHAAAALQLPLLRVERPAWVPVEGDRWHEVDDMDAAARALGGEPRRVFLTIGRLEIEAFSSAPQQHYLARAVDPFVLPLPNAKLISARGPFDVAAERELLERETIEIIVSKNAGTPATYAKIEAARALGLPIIMVRRPQLPAAETVASVAAAQAWLAGVHGASQRRGE